MKQNLAGALQSVLFAAALGMGCASGNMYSAASALPTPASRCDLIIQNRTPYTLRLVANPRLERRLSDHGRIAPSEVAPKSITMFHVSQELTAPVIIKATAVRKHRNGCIVSEVKIGEREVKALGGPSAPGQVLIFRTLDF